MAGGSDGLEVGPRLFRLCHESMLLLTDGDAPFYINSVLNILHKKSEHCSPVLIEQYSIVFICAVCLVFP
jgi:hypothetical protein